jgi:phosphoribosylaminoimidazole carboxylase (NCAIR synthetase)
MEKKSFVWLKPAIWGAVVGIVGIMILGFGQFGWMLASKAETAARERANTAVAEALAPVCAAKFFAQTDAPAKLAELKKLTSDYEQRDFIEKGGWATALVSSSPDNQLVSECAKRILAAKPA